MGLNSSSCIIEVNTLFIMAVLKAYVELCSVRSGPLRSSLSRTYPYFPYRPRPYGPLEATTFIHAKLISIPPVMLHNNFGYVLFSDS